MISLIVFWLFALGVFFGMVYGIHRATGGEPMDWERLGNGLAMVVGWGLILGIALLIFGVRDLAWLVLIGVVVAALGQELRRILREELRR